MKQKSRVMAVILSVAALMCYGIKFIQVDFGTIGALMENKIGFGLGLLDQILPKMTMPLSGWEMISSAGLAGVVPGLSGHVRVGAFLLWLLCNFCIALLVVTAAGNLLYKDEEGKLTMAAGMTVSLLHAGIWSVLCARTISLVSPLAIELAILAAVMPVIQEVLQKKEQRRFLQISAIACGGLAAVISMIGIWVVYPKPYPMVFYISLFITAACITAWECIVLIKDESLTEQMRTFGGVLSILLFMISCMCILPAVPKLGAGWLGVMLCDLAVFYTGAIRGRYKKTEGAGGNLRNKPLTGQIVGLSGVYESAVIDILPGDELTIGSNSSEAQIIITEGKISPKHLIIAYNQKNSIYEVVDCSESGTFTESGERISANQIVGLPRNTVLCLGDKTNRFRLI